MMGKTKRPFDLDGMDEVDEEESFIYVVDKLAPGDEEFLN